MIRSRTIRSVPISRIRGASAPNFTLNYGVRYDVEFTPTFKPVNALSAAAQDKLGITQGIPRDTNNVAPRIGFAWDPWNDQKTVVRASYGIFYDHPLLALAFNSDITDGSQAPQLAFFGGSPTAPCGTNLNAGALFQGTFNGGCFPGWQFAVRILAQRTTLRRQQG